MLMGISRFLASSSLNLEYLQQKENSSPCHSWVPRPLVSLTSFLHSSESYVCFIRSVEGFGLYLLGGMGKCTSSPSSWKQKSVPNFEFIILYYSPPPPPPLSPLFFFFKGGPQICNKFQAKLNLPLVLAPDKKSIDIFKWINDLIP